MAGEQAARVEIRMTAVKSVWVVRRRDHLSRVSESGKKLGMR